MRLLLPLVLLASGCGGTADVPPTLPVGEVLRISGTVQYLDIEGGHFVIRDQAGTAYNPVDLPPEFRVEGLAVEAEARRREDVMSTTMTGPIVELLHIRRAADGPGGPPPLAGIWTIVSHHIPGTSAMDGAQAQGWHGRTLRLEAEEALIAGERCAAPRYRQSTVKREELLSDHRLGAQALAPLAGVAQPEVLRVSCNGAPWTAAGATLIGIDADRALAPWDGVFFELRRDRDFRALGQEPGWRLDVRKGKELHLLYDYGEHELSLPAPVPELQGANTVLHVATGEHEINVVIVPAPCTDSMSGAPFDAQVTVTLGDRQLQGCGSALE